MSKEKKQAGNKKSGARSSARLAAVQAVYQAHMSEMPISTAVGQILAAPKNRSLDEAELMPPDEDLLLGLALGVEARKAEIDEILSQSLSANWSLDRLDTVLRIILETAIFELIANPKVPVPVLINEYVDLVHAFYSGEEPGFANGVLDQIAKKLPDRAVETA